MNKKLICYEKSLHFQTFINFVKNINIDNTMIQANRYESMDFMGIVNMFKRTRTMINNGVRDKLN